MNGYRYYNKSTEKSKCTIRNYVRWQLTKYMSFVCHIKESSQNDAEFQTSFVLHDIRNLHIIEYISQRHI